MTAKRIARNNKGRWLAASAALLLTGAVRAEDPSCEAEKEALDKAVAAREAACPEGGGPAEHRVDEIYRSKDDCEARCEGIEAECAAMTEAERQVKRQRCDFDRVACRKDLARIEELLEDALKARAKEWSRCAKSGEDLITKRMHYQSCELGAGLDDPPPPAKSPGSENTGPAAPPTAPRQPPSMGRW